MPDATSGYSPLVPGASRAAGALGPVAGLGSLLVVTLLGGVAGAAHFPSLKPAVTRAVPVAVATPAPVLNTTSTYLRFVDPGGTWVADTSATAREATRINASDVDFGAEQTWFDDQGRLLSVDILRFKTAPTDTAVKEQVNGEHAVALTRSDDGIWTSHLDQPIVAETDGAGSRGGLIVEVYLDGEPQNGVDEVLALVRAQLANLPDADDAGPAAAPVALRMSS